MQPKAVKFAIDKIITLCLSSHWRDAIKFINTKYMYNILSVIFVCRFVLLLSEIGVVLFDSRTLWLIANL